ncbi:MAG: glycosyltransferase family 9 protein [Bacteroidales bacterium]|nr:glycosyltransferase family 9 protein [Bacteroidales bacterium]
MPEFLKKKILVIQTAFIGDAILATSVLEKLHKKFPFAQIDFLVRKGNEPLFAEHPFVHKLYVWNKKENKYRSLLKILSQIRKEEYLYVINLQRYLSTGILTVFSEATAKIGFDKNPLSRFFTKKFKHDMKSGIHEIERNHQLIKAISDENPAMPRLYPSKKQFEKVKKYKTTNYITISPASVWFTKQLPAKTWIGLIKELEKDYKIFLLGGPGDKELCEKIRLQAESPKTFNLAGKLSLLESAALMQDAVMNYTNDSAPMHLASSMNAPVTAVYCSTIPEFGFGPLSDDSYIVETAKDLTCRPCGLHGRRSCPQKHFDCAMSISTYGLLFGIKDRLKNAGRNKKNA